MASHLLSPSQSWGRVTWSPCTQVCGVNTDVLYRPPTGDGSCGTVTDVLCSF